MRGEVRLIEVDAEFLGQVENWNNINSGRSDRLHPPITSGGFVAQESTTASGRAFEEGTWATPLEREAQRVTVRGFVPVWR